MIIPHSIWRRSHKCGPNGRQTCDRCCWQVRMRRIAAATNTRVQSLREKLERARREKILAAVWQDIAARCQQKQPQGLPPLQPSCAPAEAADLPRKQAIFRYICPFCEVAIGSGVETGVVDHRRSCGHQFRVNAGAVPGTGAAGGRGLIRRDLCEQPQFTGARRTQPSLQLPQAGCLTLPSVA